MTMTYVVAAMRALLCVALLSATWARADAWTNSPVRIVVPYSAGGSTDAIGRRLAADLKEITGTSVVVENITGGGSLIGTQAVIRATPDGSSLLLTGNGTISVMKHVNPGLSTDPEKELKPITAVNTLPHWIVVRADRPERTFAEFVDHIRKNPGKVSISVNAHGGTAHLALATWAKTQKLDFTVVPYRGSSAAMVDLIGGATTAHVDVVGSSLSFVKSGRAKALTLLQKERIVHLPEVPAEAQGLHVDSWHVVATTAEHSKLLRARHCQRLHRKRPLHPRVRPVPLHQLAERTVVVRACHGAVGRQELAVAGRAGDEREASRVGEPQAVRVRGQIEGAVEADAVRRLADADVVAVGADESFTRREVGVAQTAVQGHDDRGLGAVEQVGAVVPLRGVRRAPSRHGHAIGEEQAQRLAGWQARQMADGAHACTAGRAGLGQCQGAQLAIDPRLHGV
jgi:tripartite-type tricarboxylate transporter receptor subunit TctC